MININTQIHSFNGQGLRLRVVRACFASPFFGGLLFASWGVPFGGGGGGAFNVA
jgi:hypothetical protein